MHDALNRTRFRNSLQLLILRFLNLLANLLDGRLLHSNSLDGTADCIDYTGVTI